MTGTCLPAFAAVLLFCAGAYAEEKYEPGLLGEYFDMRPAKPRNFPIDASTGKLHQTRVDKQINFLNDFKCGLLDHFYIRWTGRINIPANGMYTFILESDDGSRAVIDDQEVVNNDGMHNMDAKSGQAIPLKAGWHQILVEYFQYDRGMGCILFWEGAPGDTKRKTVPAIALSHLVTPAAAAEAATKPPAKTEKQ